MNKKAITANLMRDGSSVIQSNPQKVEPNDQHLQGMTGREGDDPNLCDSAEKQCRELLARRPSYRKLLKELSSSDPDIKSRLVRDNDDNNLHHHPLAINATSTNHHRDMVATIHNINEHPQNIDDTNGSDGSGSDDDSDSQGPRRLDGDGDQAGSSSSSTGAGRTHHPLTMHNIQAQQYSGFPNLQMSNLSNSEDGERAYHLAMNTSAAQTGSTLQHRQDLSHPGHGPHLAALLPQSSGYQLAPGVIMSGSGAASSSSISAAMAVMGQSSSPPVGEEVARKREMRLLKNREAARECRRKKKEYVKCLENRVAVLEAHNKTLIDELKALKELYCQHSVGPVPND